MSHETASHVRYIDKTRAYYQAEGYGKSYEWAFLDPKATRTWLERKETYRALKGTGTI